MTTLKLADNKLAQHLLLCGDTGTGKSTTLRQLMHYAKACGDAAVVLDSKLEFIPEFYEPGDHILSPKDERCAYWDLGGEITDEADAIATMRAFYPPIPNNSNGAWFQDHACRIAAYAITHGNPRPSCTEFASWLANPRELYRRIKGSEHEFTLNQKADNQTAGILGTLNQTGFAMRMMPPPSEANRRERFTFREWAQHRNGWVFLPNTSETRDALRPLQSGWADMALFRVMSSRGQARRVWFFFDELETLGTLSKLQDAMTQMRSTGNVLALGMQNIAQLEDRYGRQADTIFSQSFSKFIFAVSEERSAKRLESLIGEVEIRNVRQTRTTGFFGRHERDSYSGPEEVRKPLVMASEISGLPDLACYFLQRPVDPKAVGLRVVKIRVERTERVEMQPALVERLIPQMERLLEPEEPEKRSPFLNAPITVTPKTPKVKAAASGDLFAEERA